MKKKLLQLMIEEQAAGIGIYDNIHWHVLMNNKNGTTEANLISLHESLHSSLNHSSIYGFILIAYTYLYQETQEKIYSETLRLLMNDVTTTHEIYATHLSVNILSPWEFSITQKKNMLGNYPGYISYFDQGETLLKGVDNKYLQIHFLNSILIAVMQNPAIAKLFLAGPKNLKWDDLKKSILPNSRIEILLQASKQGFWKKKVIALYENLLNEKERLLIQQSAKDKLIYEQLMGVRYSNLSDRIHMFAFTETIKLLESSGIKTLAPNHHLNYIDDIINLVNSLLGDKSDRRFSLIKNTNPSDIQEFISVNFKNEIFYITKSPLKAHLYSLNQFPKDRWHELRSGIPGKKHFYISGKTVDSLLKQYKFSIENQKRLEKLKGYGLLFIRRSFEKDGVREVEIIIINQPKQLSELAKLNAGPLVSNISMCLLANMNWSKTWWQIICNLTLNTILFDLSPFICLKEMIILFDQMFYQIGNLKIEEKEYNSIFLIGKKGAEEILYIMPCSTMSITFIDKFIKERFNNAITCLDRPIEDVHAQKINYIISHLFLEEHFFIFN